MPVYPNTVSNDWAASGDVTLASAGGTETLVNDGVGPALTTKGLTAGAGGISLEGAATNVTISNTLTGASLGGTAAVFAGKTGSTLNLRGLTAGTGITVAQNANDITITNADGASTVTLASAGGTETLVNDGVGPALATKGLSVGTGGISLTGAAASVTIDNTLIGASLGGTAAVFANKTGATLNLRGITAGTGITVTQNANDIVIGNADWGSAVTLASAGGVYSLINDGAGPSLAVKGLSVGAGITVADSGSVLTLTNSNPTIPTLTSAGGTYSLVNDTGGPTLAVKGLTAGAGVTITDSASALTIAGPIESSGTHAITIGDSLGNLLPTKISWRVGKWSRFGNLVVYNWQVQQEGEGPAGYVYEDAFRISIPFAVAGAATSGTVSYIGDSVLNGSALACFAPLGATYLLIRKSSVATLIPNIATLTAPHYITRNDSTGRFGGTLIYMTS